MLVLNKKDEITYAQAMQLSDDMSLIASMPGCFSIDDFETVMNLDETLVEFFEAGGYKEDKLIPDEWVKRLVSAYESFMEAYSNYYEDYLEQCLDLKEKIQMRLEYIGTAINKESLHVDLIEKESIVDPFAYYEYLDGRYKELSRLASLVAVRKYTKTPTLIVVKKPEVGI